MISLVIFSKDNASSKWCLEELLKIMECKETNEQIVIPIFYNLNPSNVSHLKRTYADAFAKHEEESMNNMEKLRIWRSSFTKIANLSGITIHQIFNKCSRKSRDSKLLVGIYQNFSELLNQRNLHVNAATGRLQRKKVLIVLDDVDDPLQLKDLVVVEETCLGWGIRVIITSRDKHVLRSVGINEEYIHEVKELNFEESLKLFSLKVFKQYHPKIGYEGLSKRTVAYAKGIPLALEVLDRYFSYRSNTYWESDLRKLQKYPKQDIQNILKVRYFHWDVYPSKSLPLGFCPKNLVDGIQQPEKALGEYSLSSILIGSSKFRDNKCEWISTIDGIA
ncbi:hypothetical protein K1719_044279 [Acacia pycnantha]|nr:hypothetical protein K1719_044279 [Acacia pycnantha]